FGAHNLHENPPVPGAWRSEDVVLGTFFNAGVRAYDVRDPYSPREIAWFVPPAPAGSPVGAAQLNDVFVDDRGIVFTVDRHAGDFIVKSPPDGYNLWLQDITTHAINTALYAKLPYDSVKDFTYIAMIASTPLMLVVHPATPAHSVRELIALLRSAPGRYSYGSSGNGTIVHLSAEMLKQAAGVDVLHVPYKGSNP